MRIWVTVLTVLHYLLPYSKDPEHDTTGHSFRWGSDSSVRSRVDANGAVKVKSRTPLLLDGTPATISVAPFIIAAAADGVASTPWSFNGGPTTIIESDDDHAVRNR
jgi:hypothetical protein